MKKNNMPKKILHIAKELFYEKGYNETNLKEIAQRCGIKKQAITYYFGSKANLGLAVYDSISDELLNYFRYKVQSELEVKDMQITYAASTLWTIDYFLKDQKVLKFFEEFIYLFLSDTNLIKREKKRHLNMMDISSELISNEMFDMQYIGSRYAANGILYHFCKKDILINPEGFSRYYLSVSLFPIIRDQEKIECLYNKATEIVEKLNITIKPNFNIE